MVLWGGVPPLVVEIIGVVRRGLPGMVPVVLGVSLLLHSAAAPVTALSAPSVALSLVGSPLASATSMLGLFRNPKTLTEILNPASVTLATFFALPSLVRPTGRPLRCF